MTSFKNQGFSTHTARAKSLRWMKDIHTKDTLSTVNFTPFQKNNRHKDHSLYIYIYITTNSIWAYNTKYVCKTCNGFEWDWFIRRAHLGFKEDLTCREHMNMFPCFHVSVLLLTEWNVHRSMYYTKLSAKCWYSLRMKQLIDSKTTDNQSPRTQSPTCQASSPTIIHMDTSTYHVQNYAHTYDLTLHTRTSVR